MRKYRIFKMKNYPKSLSYDTVQKDKFNMLINGWIIKNGWTKQTTEIYMFEKVLNL